MGKRIFSEAQRAEIEADVRVMVEQHWLSIPEALRGPISQCCPFWAICTAQRIRQEGVRALIQAGTAYWPRLKDRPNDPVAAFGFEFDPRNQLNVLRMQEGYIPEMHCWVAITGPQAELVDLTTGFFPENCKAMLRRDWPGDLPPQTFWHPLADGILAGVRYAPDPVATRYLIERLIESEMTTEQDECGRPAREAVHRGKAQESIA